MNPNARVLGELQSQLLGLFDESDLRVDVFRVNSDQTHSEATSCAVRVTHAPTGNSETCNDYQTKIENQLVALARLANRVFRPE